MTNENGIAKIKKTMRVVGIDELVPYPRNPRRNNKSAKIVAESIREYGYINPIIVTDGLMVLAGHTRLKALRILKYKEVEVLVVSGLSEKQIEGFVIADNRVGEYSQWNYSELDRIVSKSGEKDGFINALGITSFEENKSALEDLINE
jgi:ParB-like chromosome segregation protein Spo0J